MPDARGEILAALNERDSGRRRRRLLALTSVPALAIDDDTLSLVVGALHDSSDLGARTAAMEILAAVGDAALPALGRLLADDNVGVRRLAVDTLGLSPSPRALPLLERATADVSTTVRAAALDGIARVGGPLAAGVLLRQLEADAPGPVALAALLGLEQLGVVAPSKVVRRWLDDALTSSAAIRLLGRAGDLVAVVPSLTSMSHVRARAAAVGIADGLERGATAPMELTTVAARTRLVSIARGGDHNGASAAILVLAHIADLDGVGTAVAREDVALLLPALHRAVELAERAGLDVHERLVRMAATATEGAALDVIRELQDAALRRRKQVGGGAVRRRERVMSLGEAEFAELAEWFSRKAGLSIAADARARVEARLLPRLEQRGVEDFRGYVALLASDTGPETAAAIECITVHETYFFREPTSLLGLKDDLAPALARSDHTFRVWSAGCSTGEESFTLAFILDDLRRAKRIADYEVIGTDISPATVTLATAGRFGPRSFRRPLLPEEEQYFEVLGSGHRTPRADIRSRVRFDVLNLVDGPGVAALPVFDVIFCRNVLIYLTPEARRTVLQRFHHRLRPGGALVLGHSESLLHVENPFGLWPMGRGLAYRRSAP